MRLEHERRLERNAPSNARVPYRRRSSVAVARCCVIRQTRGLSVENQNMSHRPCRQYFGRDITNVLVGFKQKLFEGSCDLVKI